MILHDYTVWPAGWFDAPATRFPIRLESLMCTAPDLQDILRQFDLIASVHMSGLLLRSHMNTWRADERRSFSD